MSPFGETDVSSSQYKAENYLQDAAEAFDIAVKVKRTPHPFGHKMYAHLRPYLVEGAQEMIEEGYYREAMGWTMAFYRAAMQIIQIDAPTHITPDMQAKFDECRSQLGLNSAFSSEERIARARALFREAFNLADEIVVSNQAIFD